MDGRSVQEKEVDENEQLPRTTRPRELIHCNSSSVCTVEWDGDGHRHRSQQLKLGGGNLMLNGERETVEQPKLSRGPQGEQSPEGNREQTEDPSIVRVKAYRLGADEEWWWRGEVANGDEISAEL